MWNCLDYARVENKDQVQREINTRTARLGDTREPTKAELVTIDIWTIITMMSMSAECPTNNSISNWKFSR